MTEREEDEVPSWPWLNWSIVLALASIVMMIAIISAGVFDPKPVGDLVATLPLQPVSLEAEERRLIWLKQEVPVANYTLRLTAALSTGEVDSAYGLALGQDDQYLAVAYSPAGYVSFWQQAGDRPNKTIPWRTWPHAQAENETNELWLDIVDGNLIAIRTNREIMWQGEVPIKGGQIGLWAESFGRPATFDFQQLEMFVAPPTG